MLKILSTAFLEKRLNVWKVISGVCFRKKAFISFDNINFFCAVVEQLNYLHTEISIGRTE